MELVLNNPFGGPVFHFSSISSTMDKARRLVDCGSSNGSVIVADEQLSGRGRVKGRTWASPAGSNLLFTLILQFQSLPSALSLRVGLALAQAIEDFMPSLCGAVSIKWPNDCLINRKKVAGILVESDGRTVFIGMGVNVSQRSFESELQEKATSISCACGSDLPAHLRFVLLEKILHSLFYELFPLRDNWLERVEKRLYMKGERICFKAGAADVFNTIEGKLHGIGQYGQLLIEDEDGNIQSFTTGELQGQPEPPLIFPRWQGQPCSTPACTIKFRHPPAGLKVPARVLRESYDSSSD